MFGLAGRLSGRAVVFVAVGIYVVGGLLAPLAMWFAFRAPFSLLPMASTNFLATILAGCLLFAWFLLSLRSRDRRLLLEWTTNLRLLSAEEFEWFVGEVFRREGWLVRETGHQDRGDGNVDLELSRDGRRVLVQCKRWTSWLVGVDEVRKLGGTLLREGLPGNAGMLVTLSEFTPDAVAEAERIGLSLLNHRDLHLRAEKVRRQEPCPICTTPMVLGHSAQGWWFRCVARGCAGKRDLGGASGASAYLLAAAAGELTLEP